MPACFFEHKALAPGLNHVESTMADLQMIAIKLQTRP